MTKKTLRKITAVALIALLAVQAGGCSLIKAYRDLDKKFQNVPSSPVPASEVPSSEIVSEPVKTGSSVTVQDYYDFLDGKTEALVLCDSDYLEKGERYDYVDMKNTFKNLFDASWKGSDRELQEIYYAFTDCGNDDVPEFALKFVCGTYEADDQGKERLAVYETSTYIFRYEAAQLRVVDCKVSSTRDWYDLNKYGVFCETGSGGAALHIDAFYAVTAEGKPVTLYYTEHQYGLASPLISGAELPDGSVPYDDYGGDVERFTYHFGEYSYDDYSWPESMYLFMLGEEIIYPDAEILNHYRANGYDVVGLEEVNKRIDEALSKYGVTEGMLSVAESDLAEWILVESLNGGQGGEN